MKNLFIEDCFETLKRNLTYDYVLTSPPDFDELGKDTNWSYESFLESLVEKLNPKGNFISVCISDRKSKGVIVSKHCMVINTFNKMKYKLHSHKIWVKSTGIDSKFKYAGDFDLWVKFSKYSNLFSTNINIAVFRKRIGQLSLQNKSYLNEINKINCLFPFGKILRYIYSKIITLKKINEI